MVGCSASALWYGTPENTAHGTSNKQQNQQHIFINGVHILHELWMGFVGPILIYIGAKYIYTLFYSVTPIEGGTREARTVFAGFVHYLSNGF